MKPIETLAVGLETSVGALLLVYATFLISTRRDRSAATLSLAALCAAIAIMMGANLLIEMLAWPIFTDIGLFVDLVAPALVLSLVQYARSPAPAVRPAALLNLIPAVAGLFAWKASLLSSMDPYVIACWSAYLAASIWIFVRHRPAYGSSRTRRLLTAVLVFSLIVLGLRVGLAQRGATGGSFLYSQTYILVLCVCLVGACLVLFAALRSTANRSNPIATYATRRDNGLEFDSLENRLQAALGARVYLDPNLNLDGLARRLDAPPRLVSRLINERHGENVSAFLNRLRVEAATQLLMADPPRSIKAVMYDAGFLSKSIFNGEFRRHTGLSPSEFRRRATD